MSRWRMGCRDSEMGGACEGWDGVAFAIDGGGCHGWVLQHLITRVPCTARRPYAVPIRQRDQTPRPRRPRTAATSHVLRLLLRGAKRGSKGVPVPLHQMVQGRRRISEKTTTMRVKQVIDSTRAGRTVSRVRLTMSFTAVLAPATNPDPCSKLASETPVPRAASTSAGAEMPKVAGLPAAFTTPRTVRNSDRNLGKFDGYSAIFWHV